MIDISDLYRSSVTNPEEKLWRHVAVTMLEDVNRHLFRIQVQLERFGAADINLKHSVEGLLRESTRHEFELICDNAGLVATWFSSYIAGEMHKLRWPHVRWVKTFFGEYRQ